MLVTTGKTPQHTIGMVSRTVFYTAQSTQRLEVSAPLSIDTVDFANSVLEFHRRLGAVTGSVLGTVKLIRDGASIVRLAHQPNFLPYANLFAQMCYVSYLARGAPDTAPVVLLVDHDDLRDRRFHTSYNWHPTAAGRLKAYSTKRFISNQWQVMSSARIESKDARWEAEAAASHLSVLCPEKSPAEWLSEMWPEHIFDEESVDITEFHSAPVVRMFAHAVGSGLVFCPLSKLLPKLGEALSATLGVLAELNDIWIERPPVWAVCRRCHSRNNLLREAEIYKARCVGCGDDIRIQIDDLLCRPLQVSSCEIVPKVLADTILDYLGLRAVGGSNYLSGIGHLESTLSVLQEAYGWLPRETCWRFKPWSAAAVDYELARNIKTIRPGTSYYRLAMLRATGRLGMITTMSEDSGLADLTALIEKTAEEQAKLVHPGQVDLMFDRNSPWLDNSSMANWYRSL